MGESSGRHASGSGRRRRSASASRSRSRPRGAEKSKRESRRHRSSSRRDDSRKKSRKRRHSRSRSRSRSPTPTPTPRSRSRSRSNDRERSSRRAKDSKRSSRSDDNRRRKRHRELSDDFGGDEHKQPPKKGNTREDNKRLETKLEKNSLSTADTVDAVPPPAPAPATQPQEPQVNEPGESGTRAATPIAAGSHSPKESADPSTSGDQRDSKTRSKSKSRSRSRGRTREKRRRSRSRSRSRNRERGRGTSSKATSSPQQKQKQKQSSSSSSKLNAPPTLRPKQPERFRFGGMALKSDPHAKKSTGRLNSKANGDDERKRRLEKLKLWREKQREKDEQAKRDFLAHDEAVPSKTQLGLWKLEEEEAKQETLEEKAKREEMEEQQRQRVQQVVEEVDPLDAYMAGLVDENALQRSLADPASNVISLDEIESKQRIDIYGTFIPPTPTPSTDAITPTEETAKPSTREAGTKEPEEPQETPEEREARETRELEEFMKALKQKRQEEERAAQQQAAAEEATSGAPGTTDNGQAADGQDGIAAIRNAETGRIYQGLEEDLIGEEADMVDERSALEILQEAQKKKEIKPVDHSQIDYLPFQKKFYVIPREIKQMSEEQVQAIRTDLEIKVRGKNCPRPLQKWTQCGFSVRMLQLIKKHGYEQPFAIQCQALPAIMSGRDVIGIAKTGSGKTLAFLLPMFRHILPQPPLQENEGPIGLVMAPARELVQQIYLEAKKFAKDLGLRATAVYGGSSVSEQIANLKRGSDIVICTPGRMIDILCMSAGKMVSLKRVTYVVLDEADRMFDMGFEPQITKIIMNIREDRQTLLFSATFPRSVETLARKVLKRPIEITVGTRSTASGDITQYVEVREESDKFMRLLQLLGLWYEKGNILVFVNTQQACDKVFQDLMKAGYNALSLHGGKDQVDRDYTIDDFKRKVRTLMVATSVAGRGLDVKDLVLVINYHCPNHLEDYVHRVGRTGRAGNKGTAYTFISPDEEEYAVDLVKALENAKQIVPPELTALAENFKEKVKRGEARFHGSGFKGKGFTFDENEKNEAQKAVDIQKRQYEIDQGILVEDAAEEEEMDDVENQESEAVSQPPPTSAAAAAASAAAAAAAASVATSSAKSATSQEALSAVKKAQQIAQILDMQYKQNQANAAAAAGEGHFEEELEINDYPQQARWKVTQKEANDAIAELTGAAVIARGSFFPAGRKPNPGERKLYLAIEGPTRAAVLDAKRELQRILDETTMQVGLGDNKYGKYTL